MLFPPRPQHQKSVSVGCVYSSIISNFVRIFFCYGANYWRTHKCMELVPKSSISYTDYSAKSSAYNSNFTFIINDAWGTQVNLSHQKQKTSMLLNTNSEILWVNKNMKKKKFLDASKVLSCNLKFWQDHCLL